MFQQVPDWHPDSRFQIYPGTGLFLPLLPCLLLLSLILALHLTLPVLWLPSTVGSAGGAAPHAITLECRTCLTCMSDTKPHHLSPAMPTGSDVVSELLTSAQFSTAQGLTRGLLERTRAYMARLAFHLTFQILAGRWICFAHLVSRLRCCWRPAPSRFCSKI